MRTKSSSDRVFGKAEEVSSERARYRFQRSLTGASTLIKMKNGRRRSLSNMASLCISVVTHRSRHRFVTKSRSSSVVLKTCLLGSSPPDVPFIEPFGVVDSSSSLADIGSNCETTSDSLR